MTSNFFLNQIHTSNKKRAYSEISTSLDFVSKDDELEFYRWKFGRSQGKSASQGGNKRTFQHDSKVSLTHIPKKPFQPSRTTTATHLLRDDNTAEVTNLQKAKDKNWDRVNSEKIEVDLGLSDPGIPVQFYFGEDSLLGRQKKG